MLSGIISADAPRWAYPVCSYTIYLAWICFFGALAWIIWIITTVIFMLRGMWKWRKTPPNITTTRALRFWQNKWFQNVVMWALFMPLLGVYLAASTGDWTWLDRSGALLTFYGIVYAWYRLRWFRQLRKSVADMRSGVRPHEPGDIEAYEDYLTTAAISLALPEIRMIALGTLIWGFGDLLPQVIGLSPWRFCVGASMLRALMGA